MHTTGINRGSGRYALFPGVPGPREVAGPALPSTPSMCWCFWSDPPVSAPAPLPCATAPCMRPSLSSRLARSALVQQCLPSYFQRGRLTPGASPPRKGCGEGISGPTRSTAFRRRGSSLLCRHHADTPHQRRGHAPQTFTGQGGSGRHALEVIGAGTDTQHRRAGDRRATTTPETWPTGAPLSVTVLG